MKKIVFLLLLVLACATLEPLYLDRLVFAITYFGAPEVAQDAEAPLPAKTPAITAESQKPQERARAPEPNTFILMLTGIGGILLRFARKSFERFKRGMDIILSIIGLTLTIPILLYAALLIKLTSRGPVIYEQLRLGRNGEIFKIYKLRTMRVDAEKKTGAVWAVRNDPRITPVGNILRKTRIDEIPQFFNVLKGEMSIVGPRPERPELVTHLKNLIRDYEKRLQVKPGITGLAQVLHKYDESIDDVRTKIRYDLEYIHNRCFSKEMEILGRTVVAVFTGKGAR